MLGVAELQQKILPLAQIQSNRCFKMEDFNALNSDFNSVPALFSGKPMEFHLYYKKRS
jgi:hypothetical protein